MTYDDRKYPAKGSGLPRSADHRPHLTDIIREIGVKLGLIPNYAASGNDWDLDMAGDLGFMWEEMLTYVFAERMRDVIRPGEVELDGIVGSPDGLGVDPEDTNDLIVEEYKLTWKSAKNLPTENWYWMTQSKGYCRMCGVNTVIMRIAYINGDYKGSGPIYREARITFSEQELWENWRMLTDYARRVNEYVRALLG